MDIQLSDGISFDIFEHIEIETPIIFTTAYDEYAVQAFQVNSLGYILKPVEENKLIKAVEKLKNSNFAPYENQVLQSLIKQAGTENYKERFVIKLGDEYIIIPVSSIAYFYSEDKFCYLVTQKNKSHITDQTLDVLEKSLNPEDFFRLSRNCIASIGSIGKVSKYFNSRLSIELKPAFKDKILVSRVRVPVFFNWLDK